MIEKLIQKSKNITASGRNDIEPAWIAQAQQRLGFALPASYKQMLLRYASVSAAGTELKTRSRRPSLRIVPTPISATRMR